MDEKIRRDHKRKIGEELLIFTSGEELKVDVHAVSNYNVGQERKRYSQTIFDKKGGFKSVEFNSADFALSVAKLSMGNQVTLDDLKNVDNIEWSEFHDKYFKLSKEKKPKSPDIVDSNQDKE
jgi:hypothetical protein